MRIITIFLSSINKYGVKFLFFIFLHELINTYRLRLHDYLALNPIKKDMNLVFRHLTTVFH